MDENTKADVNEIKEVIKRIAEKRLKRERKVNHLFDVPSSTDLFRSLSVHHH